MTQRTTDYGSYFMYHLGTNLVNTTAFVGIYVYYDSFDFTWCNVA